VCQLSSNATLCSLSLAHARSLSPSRARARSPQYLWPAIAISRRQVGGECERARAREGAREHNHASLDIAISGRMSAAHFISVSTCGGRWGGGREIYSAAHFGGSFHYSAAHFGGSFQYSAAHFGGSFHFGVDAWCAVGRGS